MINLNNKSLRWFLLILAAALCTTLVVSCSSGDNPLPKSDKILKIEEYFLGNSKAYGVIFDRGGDAQRYFSVDLVGTWDEADQTLTLDEDFVYNDGEKSQRQWVIKKLDNNQYSGTAEDVIGVAKGVAKGNSFHWNYVLEVPYKDGTIALNIDDWLFLSDDNVLINRAEMYKFGFKVGEIVISFNRQE